MPAEPPGPHHDWLDEEAGPVFRPYTVTGGRGRPVAGGFDLVAFVLAGPPSQLAGRPQFQPEHRALMEIAQERISVAELSARLDLALGVVRVLLGDLLAAGLIDIHEPPANPHIPDDDILKAVANGLRAL